MILDDHDKLIIKRTAWSSLMLFLSMLIWIYIDGKLHAWPVVLILFAPFFALRGMIELLASPSNSVQSDRRARKQMHRMMKRSPYLLAICTGILWAVHAGRWEILWLIIAVVACFVGTWAVRSAIRLRRLGERLAMRRAARGM